MHPAQPRFALPGGVHNNIFDFNNPYSGLTKYSAFFAPLQCRYLIWPVLNAPVQTISKSVSCKALHSESVLPSQHCQHASPPGSLTWTTS